MHTFIPGDVVAYSRAFLRSGGFWQHDIASLTGTVAVVHEPIRSRPQALEVRWADGQQYPVLACNLVLASRKHLEPR